jgi:hypothetical protein
MDGKMKQRTVETLKRITIEDYVNKMVNLNCKDKRKVNKHIKKILFGLRSKYGDLSNVPMDGLFQ